MLDPSAETITVGGVAIPLGDNRLLKARRSGDTTPPGVALAEAVDSGLGYTTGGDANWQKVSSPAHYGGDAATGTAWSDGNSWMQTTVSGAGTLKFWWKVSSESGGDYLYPEAYFVRVKLSQKAQKAVAARA